MDTLEYRGTAIGKGTIPKEEQKVAQSIDMTILATIKHVSLSNTSQLTLVKASPTQLSKDGRDECRITFCSNSSNENSVTQFSASKELTRDQWFDILIAYIQHNFCLLSCVKHT